VRDHDHRDIVIDSTARGRDELEALARFHRAGDLVEEQQARCRRLRLSKQGYGERRPCPLAWLKLSNEPIEEGPNPFVETYPR
jgi:hypothetical protein